MFRHIYKLYILKTGVLNFQGCKTSKLCSKCENALENYKGLHRVLVCRDYKCNGCESKRITFINRDMNACMNMINISKSFINNRNRPINFCRENNELIINNQNLINRKTSD